MGRGFCEGEKGFLCGREREKEGERRRETGRQRESVGDRGREVEKMGGKKTGASEGRREGGLLEGVGRGTKVDSRMDLGLGKGRMRGSWWKEEKGGVAW